MYRYGLPLIMAGFLVACGSSSSGGDVLHLRGGDISPTDARAYSRSLLEDPRSAGTCATIKGLDAPSVVLILKDGPASESDSALAEAPGLIPRAGQEAEYKSELRLAKIILEECARLRE